MNDRDLLSTTSGRSQRGAVAVLVAIIFGVLLGLVAYAVDINHLYVVRNELQNAADAGALAGALALYEDPDGAGPLKPGSQINTGANQAAFDVATANVSDKSSVDVHWSAGNSGDIQRGHWRLSSRSFTPNASLLVTDLWLKSEAELDADTDFINAVRVVVRREDTPATSFFAKLMGHGGFVMQADAVAYVGFSGSLAPLAVAQPIVICEETLTNVDGEYQCNVGRMQDSGASCPPSDPGCETTINTAGWSDMTILDSGKCTGSASASDVRPLICQGGANATEINVGDLLQATNGVQASTYNDLQSCWSAATGGGRHPYQMTLPVVDCGPGRQVDNCVKVLGTVTVNMLFMSDSGSAKPADAPAEMSDPDPEHVYFDDWDASADCSDFNALVGLEQKVALPQLPGEEPVIDKWLIDERWNGDKSKKPYTADMARWDCFVDHFNLINTNNKVAPLKHKTMYFMPDCSPHLPEGNTAGPNLGVLARIPVLVE